MNLCRLNYLLYCDLDFIKYYYDVLDSDISMFEMRKSHLEVKIELLKEIQDP